MAEYAPNFDNNILPKNTTPLTNRRVTNALVSTTVGAVAGTTTTVNTAQVGQPSKLIEESKRNINSIAEINRASTAADVTALKTKFTKKKPQFVFPADKSGNGGPSFTRG